MLLIFVFLLVAPNLVLAIDDAVEFVSSYIKNEEKPTFLVYDVCWPKKSELFLVNQLALLGVRATKSMDSSKYQDHETLYLLDLDCNNTMNILEYASSKNLLRAPYRWLVLSSGAGHQTLEHLSILTDSEFVLARSTDSEFTLNELYKPSPSGPLKVTPRGNYNGSLVDFRGHKTFFARRRDLMGHPLTMSNVIQDSNSTKYHLPMENRLEPEHDAIAKISWSNVRIAFEMLNATPRYLFSYRWGYKQNGSWSGMIDDLYSDRADVGTNCLVTIERLPVAVYTDVLAPFRVRFIFRQPPLAYVTNIFSLPFSNGVWVAMAVCSAMATAVLYMTSRMEAREEKSAARLDGSIGDALLLTMSAVSQQGCVMEPKKASGRILVWVLFATLMATYAAYSANVVVLLQAPSSSVRSLAQLAHSKLTIAAYDVDYNHFVFKMYNKDPVRLEIIRKLENEKGRKHFYDFNDGVERIRQVSIDHVRSKVVRSRYNKLDMVIEKSYDVQENDSENERFSLNELSNSLHTSQDASQDWENFHQFPLKWPPDYDLAEFCSGEMDDHDVLLHQGLFAFHSIAEPVYRRIEETFLEIEKCDLMEVDFLSDFESFTPVKRGSPYLELLRVVFKQIRESGVRSCLNSRLQVPKPRCSNKMTAFTSVGLLGLKPVLFLMLYGVAISILIIFSEIVIFKLSRRHCNNHPAVLTH